MRERHLWKLLAQVPGVADRGGTIPAAEEVPRRGGGAANGSRADHACPLVWTPRESAHVDQLWKRWGLGETTPVVLISPGARSHIKRWTAEGFAQAADRLMAEAGVAVIFSGEPDEEPVIEAIRALMRGRAHSAVGLTTVRQLGLLMQRVRLVITNDSALLHLASAAGVPTVAIFGPTDEAKYGPTAPGSRTIHRRLFCAPCEQALCAFNHECMRFIEADEVFAAAKELLRTAS